MKTILNTLFLLLISFLSCEGAIFYEWQDAEGVVHITDDATRVPERYKNKVRERNMGPSPPAQESAPQGAPGGPLLPGTPPPAAPAPATGAGAAVVYGGHPAQWWHNRFNTLRAQLVGVQQGLAGKEQNMTELHRKRVIFQRAQDRVTINQLSAEIDADQAKVKELQQTIEALQLEADRAGVPAEWR